MSLRTVWEKWNIASAGFTRHSDYLSSDYYIGNGPYYISSDCSEDSKMGVFTLINADKVSASNIAKARGTHLMVGSSSGSSNFVSSVQTWSIDSGYLRIGSTSIYHEYYTETYKKGTTSYGLVTSVTASSYPNNSYSGTYWYVKKGQDAIDPSAVSYDIPQGGQLLDISIIPSTGKVYNGNVSYKYEISLDGGTTWSVANESTTAETISVLVPYGSESFTARVTASDDLGFTSTDAVTGQTFAVNNNAAPVITCGISDLGIVEAGFTVPYSVSDADGDDITVDIKLDGTKIQSAVTPSGGVLTAA